ncbi:MAG: adenylate kinase [Acidimicrobiia bacterium]|nr:adenylate kinase [Acidimicrobiia bacterium]
MSNGLRLVLLGKQGAGKGTQAVLVAEHCGIPHLSTGEVFRAQAGLGTAFGLEAKRYMDGGDLVPDDIVIGVIEECLAPGGMLADGFVLDGFPRTLRQAEELDRVLGRRSLDAAVLIDVPHAVVQNRLAGRRVCRGCQRVYHVDLPPERPWICDTCGGDVVQRDDDTDEAIGRRLEIYERDTAPIIEMYRLSGRLLTVDGVGSSEEIFGRIVAAIEAATGVSC